MNGRTDRSGAVVVGGYVNALNVVRSLAPMGVRIAVVTTERFDIAHRSRWCDERIDLTGEPHFEETLHELLARNRERWSGRVVFPTTDSAMLALANLRDELPAYRMVAPPPGVARLLLEKDKTEENARAVGIDTPRVYGPAEPEICARGDLRYPVVVKPVMSHQFAGKFGCKLFLARGPAELSEAVGRVGEAGLRARVLDFVPGGDDACYNYCLYIAGNGEVVAGLGMHKLRKSPPFFGVCRVAEPWDDDSLRGPTVALLRRMGYRGMANAEYKLDPRDGRMRLMEVNGRPFLMAGLARLAGVDMMRLAWAENTGAPFPGARYNGWRGHWIHLHADLLYALLFRRTEALSFGEYARPYLRSPAFAVLSLRDPLPFLMQWLRTLVEGVAMTFNRTRRKTLLDSVQPPHPMRQGGNEIHGSIVTPQE